MAKPGQAHRRDANTGKIVAEFYACGASVVDLTQVGGGCPDLLVGYKGECYLVEIKNLDGRGNRWTDEQREFTDAWRGGEIHTVYEVVDVRYLLSAWDIDERELEY